MIKRITLLCLMISVAVVTAQDKTSLAFLPISFDEATISSSESRIIQEAIVNAFVSSKKFTIVDRERIEELEKEKNLQRTEAFMDSDDAFTDGLSKGANYIVDGNIMMLRHTEERERWNTNIVVQLRLLNVSTGEIMSTQSINSDYVPVSPMILKAMKSHFSKNEMKAFEVKSEQLQALQTHKEDAFSLALMRLGENVKSFAGSLLPLQVEVVSWDLKKNEIVLGAGSGAGVETGQLANVVRFTTVTVGVDEVKRSQVVGTAWVIRVDDQNFSVATIIDNLKDIRKIVNSEENLGVIIK